MNKNFKTAIVIDESKWRCGSAAINSKNKKGDGPTRLLNTFGFMCCLGMACLQLDPILSSEDIESRANPRSLKRLIPFLTEHALIAPNGENVYRNTDLADKAMAINDDDYSRVEYKKEQLTELFSDNGLELVFINTKE